MIYLGEVSLYSEVHAEQIWTSLNILTQICVIPHCYLWKKSIDYNVINGEICQKQKSLNMSGGGSQYSEVQVKQVWMCLGESMYGKVKCIIT